VIPTIRVPVEPSNTSTNAPKLNLRVYYDGTPILDGSTAQGILVNVYAISK